MKTDAIKGPELELGGWDKLASSSMAWLCNNKYPIELVEKIADWCLSIQSPIGLMFYLEKVRKRIDSRDSSRLPQSMVRMMKANPVMTITMAIHAMSPLHTICIGSPNASLFMVGDVREAMRPELDIPFEYWEWLVSSNELRFAKTVKSHESVNFVEDFNWRKKKIWLNAA